MYHMQTPAPFNSSSQPPMDLTPLNFVPSMPTSTPPLNLVWDLRTAQGSPVIMSPGLSSYPPAQAIHMPSTQPFGAESDLTHNKPAPAVASSPSVGTSAETSTTSCSHETTIERGEGCRACSVDHKTVSTSSLAKEAAESGFSASPVLISNYPHRCKACLKKKRYCMGPAPMLLVQSSCTYLTNDFGSNLTNIAASFICHARSLGADRLEE